MRGGVRRQRFSAEPSHSRRRTRRRRKVQAQRGRVALSSLLVLARLRWGLTPPPAGSATGSQPSTPLPSGPRRRGAPASTIPASWAARASPAWLRLGPPRGRWLYDEGPSTECLLEPPRPPRRALLGFPIGWLSLLRLVLFSPSVPC